MDEALQIYSPPVGSWQFIPSHLTKALIASGAALLCGGYAAWEFKQVKAVEILALLGKF